MERSTWLSAAKCITASGWWVANTSRIAAASQMSARTSRCRSCPRASSSASSDAAYVILSTLTTWCPVARTRCRITADPMNPQPPVRRIRKPRSPGVDPTRVIPHPHSGGKNPRARPGGAPARPIHPPMVTSAEPPGHRTCDTAPYAAPRAAARSAPVPTTVSTRPPAASSCGPSTRVPAWKINAPGTPAAASSPSITLPSCGAAGYPAAAITTATLATSSRHRRSNRPSSPSHAAISAGTRSLRSRRQQCLALRVAEPHVVLDQPRPLPRQHQPGEQHPAERRPPRRHHPQRRPDEHLHRRHPVEPRHRRERPHPPRVRPHIPVPHPLVVPCRAQEHRIHPVAQREQAALRPRHPLLDHQRPRRPQRHHGRLRLRLGPRDHDALARRQPVRLHDDGRPAPPHEVQRRPHILEPLPQRRRDPRLLAHPLRERLAPLQLRRRPARPEAPHPRLRHRIRQPRHQRPLRPHHHQVDPLRLREPHQPHQVHRRQCHVHRQRRRPRVARRHEQRRNQRRRPDRPRQRMLPPARTHHQNPHRKPRFNRTPL